MDIIYVSKFEGARRCEILEMEKCNFGGGFDYRIYRCTSSREGLRTIHLENVMKWITKWIPIEGGTLESFSSMYAYHSATVNGYTIEFFGSKKDALKCLRSIGIVCKDSVINETWEHYWERTANRATNISTMATTEEGIA